VQGTECTSAVTPLEGKERSTEEAAEHAEGALGVFGVFGGLFGGYLSSRCRRTTEFTERTESTESAHIGGFGAPGAFGGPHAPRPSPGKPCRTRCQARGILLPRSPVLEVELKAWADLASARKRLEALGKKPSKHSVKEDLYFCETNVGPRAVDPLRDRVVRLRIDDKKAVVTAKRKEIDHGIEASQEIEFGTDSPVAVKQLLDYLGYRPFLKKRKESHVFEWHASLSVELNQIEGLGDFVEVETLLPEGSSPEALEKARKELRSVLSELGIGEDRIEGRPYMVLLGERGASA
jgi:adenylate cyclase class 2